ncbi:MAG TPA: hypothetical protein VGY55_02855 [Pirellulales bacterium]|jgi:plasmid stability protein|nr:hypothetical protein [Pirellulales bacterium]
MNLVLNLPPETEAKLRQAADRSGKAPEALALEALDDKLSGELGSQQMLAPDEWLRQFDAWVSGHESRNPRVDGSRESIYPDRW